jgi:putative flippase GtrA
MPKLKKKQRKIAIQFAKYCVSGGAYFWSGYLMFFIADKGLHWNLWWAKMSANLVGWMVNYTLQRFWAFNSAELKKHTTQVTTRYMIITFVDFLLDYVIVAGLKNLGLTPYLGQFASAGFFTFWNYFWYKYWVFPEKFSKRKSHLHTLRVAHRPHGHGAYRAA